MAYAIVTREAMASEDVAYLRKSFKYQPSGVDTAVENGNVVLIGKLITGERETYTASTPAANSDLSSILLVTTPEVMVDERKKNLSDFRNEAGDVCTGDKLKSGDIFSVTAEGFTGTPAKDKIVELQAGTKLNCVDTLTSGSTQVGTIVDFVNNKYAVLVK
jgi:hypothetical protein